MKVVVLGASNVGSHFMEFCEKEHLNVTLIDKSAQALEPFKNKKFITTFQEDFNHTDFFNQSFFKKQNFFLQSLLLMRPILLLVKQPSKTS